ncbi:hypothetical protein A8C56_10330 [Niabella ginsenosidivorans]|uniref:Cytochrome c domain-containing protein n=1 Tax=Niabella ginsenosidivorans TaxID=1176587 RepID=A0A1A9I105_9BACT|nr:cbb3-type cytochrome c oxidase N-terminal domain-containing protein [Niabella ginsenosidivorans]ANH81328.1 hypothetical protein A8C56_10330 [Niabella ginsenosidivorans]
MNRKQQINNRLLLFISGSLCPLSLLAQEKAVPTPRLILDVNTVLTVMIVFLLFIIGILAFTLRASMDVYQERKAKEKKESTMIKPLLLIAAVLCAATGWAQDAAPAIANPFTYEKIARYVLIGALALELLIICAFIYWIRFFTGIEELQERKALARKERFKRLGSWWSRANKLKPIEEEHNLDVGHSYDGIRELDNPTPPWFSVAFIASILFGLGYLWRYHVAHAAPNQYEEYEIAVTKGNLRVAEYLKTKGDAVNEQTVVMLDAAGIEAGKKLFVNNCTACHGNAGQGGVGPNLTDDYWLHGGAIGSVFHTIKFGVVEKGMMSWKDVFSAQQIAELASYIKSLHGTNPPGAKEPQGELYKDESAKKDSVAARPADSAASRVTVSRD